MDALADLELLSLVSKITTELSNHLGINEKTISEYIISLHGESTTLDEFKLKLADVGVEFPNSLAETIDRLILTMHPKHRNKKSKDNNGAAAATEPKDVDKKARVFTGLALPDKNPWDGNGYLDQKENGNGKNGAAKDAIDDTLAAFEKLEHKTKSEKNGSAPVVAVDDTLALLESMEPGRAPPPRKGDDSTRKRSVSPYEDSRRSKRRTRHRSRSRSRSISPDARRDRKSVV